MYRYAENLLANRFSNAYRTNEAVRNVIKMAIALTVLPPALVWAGIEVIPAIMILNYILVCNS